MGFFSAAASFAGSHRETKIVGGIFLRFLDLQWFFFTDDQGEEKKKLHLWKKLHFLLAPKTCIST